MKEIRNKVMEIIETIGLFDIQLSLTQKIEIYEQLDRVHDILKGEMN